MSDEIVSGKTLSPAEFCDKHSMSLSLFNKLKRRKLIRVSYLPGVRKGFITAKDERAFLRTMERLQSDATVKSEAERRRQAAITAGTRAAQSPAHISQIRREKAKAKAAAARDTQS